MDYLFISVGILAVINIAVSIYLFKRDDLEQFQKTAQIIVVWMIPFVGAIAFWLFHRSQDHDTNKPSGGAFGGGHASGSSSVSSAGD
jgi:hypothetical protein